MQMRDHTHDAGRLALHQSMVEIHVATDDVIRMVGVQLSRKCLRDDHRRYSNRLTGRFAGHILVGIKHPSCHQLQTQRIERAWST